MPGQQRCRRHDGGHFLKHAPASFLGLDRQLSALIVVKAPPLVSQWLTQDPVLFLKIVDDILLPLVQPACKGNQSRRKGSSAGRFLNEDFGQPCCACLPAVVRTVPPRVSSLVELRHSREITRVCLPRV